MDRTKIQRLSLGLLDREIRSATDPEGSALLGRLAGCANEVHEPLQRRSLLSDDTAGTALLVLAEAGFAMSDDDWQIASLSKNGARRAAAARSSQSVARWIARDKFLNDPDPRARQAALEAFIEAPSCEGTSNEGLSTLVSILRRDPEPQCRHLAAKAIGIVGGPEASSVLADAWVRADSNLRLAIVSAWAQTRTFAQGGRERLIAVARSEPGSVGVLAAADLARGNSPARSHGQARLTRTLEFGSIDDRPLAISAADWSLPEHASLLLRLGLTAETETRVFALERWLEQPAHHWPAITWLRSIAEQDSTAAILARAFLANADDLGARASLRAQLSYAKFESRAYAARSLWRLGDMNGMAQALADDAPEVRVTTACIAIGGSSPIRKR